MFSDTRRVNGTSSASADRSSKRRRRERGRSLTAGTSIPDAISGALTTDRFNGHYELGWNPAVACNSVKIWPEIGQKPLRMLSCRD
jgi:hypothetical protein